VRIASVWPAIPRDYAAASDRRLRRRTILFRTNASMRWLIVALLLFAASIVAALLQARAVSAALAVAAIAVAVASQLVRRAARRAADRPLAASADATPPANDAH
jgi:hypothetical protein